MQTIQTLGNTTLATAKVRYVRALHADLKSTETLTSAVLSAVQAGATRADLVAWGVESGFSESHVRSTVSRILVQQGNRRNLEGQGRQGDPAAQILADFVVANLGGDHKAAVRILRAAMRVEISAAKAAE